MPMPGPIRRPLPRRPPAECRSGKLGTSTLASRAIMKGVSAFSVFEHAGREEALHRLEEIFYASVLADPVLQPLFGAGRPEHVDHLTAFTAESFGGPDRFTKELGFDHLIDVHRGLQITEEHRTRFVEPSLRLL